jgi:thiol-disulfide isomerase/thioredoxin
LKRTVIFIVVVVVAITVLLFAGKSATKPAKADGSGKAVVGHNAGNQAPDFELALIEGHGKTMKLSELKGKGVLLNFWATWCEPCKIETPWLVDLQKKYGPQGLQIVGVADDDSPQPEIAAFAKKMGMNYPIVQGTEKVVDAYGGYPGLPASFFIDRSGKVVMKEVGLVGQDVLEKNIQKTLEESKTN